MQQSIIRINYEPKKKENEIWFLRTDVSSKEVIMKTNNEKSSIYCK